MRLDRAGIIAGRPIKQVRDFLRIQRDSPASSDRVARFFDVDLQAAKSIIDAMLERKLIAETSAPWDPQMVVYEVTGLGLRFAAARLLKPISRQRADHVVRGLLARVEEVNARDELTHFVGEVRAFGSYITDSPELGDIDLSISFLPNPPPSGVGYIEWYLERAERSGCYFGSYIDRLLYCEGEVRRIVKARNRYVSIHPLSDLDELNIESRELYKSPIRPIYSPGAGGSSMP